MMLELEAFCVCYVARERISSLLLHIIGTPYPIPDILILFCPIPNRKEKKSMLPKQLHMITYQANESSLLL